MKFTKKMLAKMSQEEIKIKAMETIVVETRKAVKQLPVSYYTKSSIPFTVTLDEKGEGTSYVNLEKRDLHISLHNVATMIEEGYKPEEILLRPKTIEEMVRNQMYHEFGHAIMTPKDLMKGQNPFNCRIINITEDERLETVLKNYFLGVDFKKCVILLNHFKGEAAKNPMSYYYHVVRFRHGEQKHKDLIADFIDKWEHLKGDSFEEVKNKWGRYMYEIEEMRNDMFSLFRTITTDWLKTNDPVELRFEMENPHTKDGIPYKEPEPHTQEEIASAEKWLKLQSEDDLAEAARRIMERAPEGDGGDDNDDDDDDDDNNNKGKGKGKGKASQGNGDGDGDSDGDSDDDDDDGDGDGGDDDDDEPSEEEQKAIDKAKEEQKEQEEKKGKQKAGKTGGVDPFGEYNDDMYDPEIHRGLERLFLERIKRDKKTENRSIGWNGKFNAKLMAKGNRAKTKQVFEKRTPERGNKFKGKEYVNLIMVQDISGSYAANAQATNKIFEALDRIEHDHDKIFKWNLICVNTQVYPRPKNQHKIIPNGGTSLTPALEDAIKKFEDKKGFNIYLTLFDGTCNNGQYFEFLNKKNSIIIDNRNDNATDIDRYAPLARRVSVTSGNFAEVLYENIHEQLSIVLR